MGRKGKPDEPEQFEVWILYEDGQWKQVQENGDPIFKQKARALALGQKKSDGPGVVEVMVISRRPIAVFNGEAVGTKHNLKLVKKEENDHAEVQRDRQDAGDVDGPATQHVGPTAPGGHAGEGAPVGPG